MNSFCPICYSEQDTFHTCGVCKNKCCTSCNDKVMKCPFCRHSNLETKSVLKRLVFEGHGVEVMLSVCEQGLLESVKYLVSFGLYNKVLYHLYDCGQSECVVCVAAIHGHLDIVLYFISLGIDIIDHIVFEIFAADGNLNAVQQLCMATNVDKDDALHWAARRGHLNIIKYLVFMGADIHDDNECALRYACAYGHLEVVKYLVSIGADININSKWPALFYASEHMQEEIIRYLISIGANIHSNTEYALYAACSNNKLQLVKYLVSLGADIHVKEENESIMTTCAVERGHLDILKYLVSIGADIDGGKDRLVTIASRQGYLHIVKYLVSLGADMNAHGKENLIESVSGGYLELTQYFIDNGVAYDDNTLRCASKYGHLEIVKYLVSLGADIHAEGEWALKYACKKDHINVVEYLVSKGSNIRVDDNLPLDIACKYGNIEIAKYLVSLGADIYAIKKDSLRYAVNRCRFQIMRYLLSIDSTIYDKDYVLIQVSKYGDIDMMEYLVSLGADIHADNNSAFRSAISRGYLTHIKYLISMGAKLDTDDALCLASDYLDVVQYLVSAGMNTSNHINNALCESSKKGKLKMVQYLVSIGADAYSDALYIARENNWKKIALYLALKQYLKAHNIFID